MNWLKMVLSKEARSRYGPGQTVRFFVGPLKGKKTKTLRPHFNKGTVKGLDKRRYLVETEDGKEVSVHPRDVTGD